MRPKRQSEEVTNHPLGSDAAAAGEVLGTAAAAEVLGAAAAAEVLGAAEYQSLDVGDSTKLDVRNDLGR